MDLLEFLRKNIDQLLGIPPKTNGISAPPVAKKKVSDVLIDLDDDEEPPAVNWQSNNPNNPKNVANQIPLCDQVNYSFFL
jgi:hypothetical protein